MKRRIDISECVAKTLSVTIINIRARGGFAMLNPNMLLRG